MIYNVRKIVAEELIELYKSINEDVSKENISGEELLSGCKAMTGIVETLSQAIFYSYVKDTDYGISISKTFINAFMLLNKNKGIHKVNKANTLKYMAEVITNNGFLENFCVPYPPVQN